jgi:hypothetical protein
MTRPNPPLSLGEHREREERGGEREREGGRERERGERERGERGERKRTKGRWGEEGETERDVGREGRKEGETERRREKAEGRGGEQSERKRLFVRTREHEQHAITCMKRGREQHVVPSTGAVVAHHRRQVETIRPSGSQGPLSASSDSFGRRTRNLVSSYRKIS